MRRGTDPVYSTLLVYKQYKQYEHDTEDQAVITDLLADLILFEERSGGFDLRYAMKKAEEYTGKDATG